MITSGTAETVRHAMSRVSVWIGTGGGEGQGSKESREGGDDGAERRADSSVKLQRHQRGALS